MTDLSKLPRVDHVLDDEALSKAGWRRSLAKREVVRVLDELREQARAGELQEVPNASALAQRCATRLASLFEPGPTKVVNATGVVLHTNLGRAPLSPEAVAAMREAAGSCDLELDLETGRRGSRMTRLIAATRAALDAEEALVVNNGAAALLLACAALGGKGGVAISRGQMVEIGDGFRVAEMAGASGVGVWEVGSTNRTHLRDFEAALAGALPGQGEGVGALLWVHPSNFTQAGFVSSVELTELAALAKRSGAVAIADLGSGALGDAVPPGEPTFAEALAAGADVVISSGDKLLGGPQAGILIGTHEAVKRCRRHPMARALRPDKTTVAALHATLRAHARAGSVELPVQRMLRATPDALRSRAESLVSKLGWGADAIVEVEGRVGGGATPERVLASVALVVPTTNPNRDARRLRLGSPPVVSRVHEERLLIDLRTVDPEDDPILLQRLSDG